MTYVSSKEVWWTYLFKIVKHELTNSCCENVLYSLRIILYGKDKLQWAVLIKSSLNYKTFVYFIQVYKYLWKPPPSYREMERLPQKIMQLELERIIVLYRNMSDKQMHLFLNFFVTLKTLRNCKYYAPMQQVMCFVE